MIFGQIEKIEKRKIKLINFISFLNGFSQAVVVYVLSTFFEKSSGVVNIGIFYTVAFLFVLLISLNLHKTVRRLGKSNVFFFTILIKILAIGLLLFSGAEKISVIWGIIYLIAAAIEWTMLDVILESFSQDRVSGRIRGLHLTVYNAGFLFGPFLSAKILEKFDFYGIFTVAFILASIIFIVALVGLRKVNHQFNQRLSVLNLIKKIWKRKNIVRIYWISFVLEAFFALMIIYVPIYLIDVMRFSWEDIGKVFTIMLIPFVILQYPMGILADKKFGEKEFLIFSIILMGLATLAVYFICSQSLWVWALVLFMTRVGAALIEILRDSYFYKQISGYDVDIINFFRTAMPMGYIFSTAISALILIFFPVKSAFILVAILIFSALYPAWKLIDNPCEEELENKL
jgi:MFS family permease